MNTVAGWYPAPDRPQELRYWDGTVWTTHYAPMAANNAGEWPTDTSVGSGMPSAASDAVSTSGRKKSAKRSWTIIGSAVTAVAIIGVLVAGAANIITTGMANLEGQQAISDAPPGGGEPEAMTIAMNADDREAFLAGGSGEAVEQLAHLWDQTKAIGWDVGVVDLAALAPESKAKFGEDADAITVAFNLGGFDVRPTGYDRDADDPDDGLTLAGYNYVVTYSESQMFEDGSYGRLITSLRPEHPMPWDTPEGAATAKRDHVVLIGPASDKDYLESLADGAESAAKFNIEHFPPYVSEENLPGFIAFASSSEEAYSEYLWGTNDEANGVTSPTERVYSEVAPEQISARSLGTVLLNPAAIEEYDRVLAHEFAHVLQRLEVDRGVNEFMGGKDLLSGGKALSEGHARYIDRIYSGRASEFVSDMVKDVVASGSSGIDSLLESENFSNDRRNDAYLVSGAYYYFLEQTGGDPWLFLRDSDYAVPWSYNSTNIFGEDQDSHGPAAWAAWLATQ